MDNTTLILFIFCESIALAGLLLLLRLTIHRFRGLMRWSAGELLIGIGFLLLGYQLMDNYLVGIVLANSLIVAGLCLLDHGLWAFLDANPAKNRFKGFLFYLPIFFAVPLMYWFSIVHFQNNVRMFGMCVIFAAQFMTAAWMIFFHRALHNRGAAWFTSGVFGLLALWFVIRIIFIMDEVNPFMKVHTPFQNATILILSVGAVAWTFGLLLLATTRLASELSQHERNLSERKRDRLVRTIIDAIPQHIILKDPSSHYLVCNTAFARSLGLDAEKLVGTTDYDHCTPELAEKFQAQDRQVIETGHILECVDVYDQNGRQSWQESIKAPVYGEDGCVQGVLTVFRDITDRIQAERNLQESEQRYRELSGKLEQKVEERTMELKKAQRAIDLFFEVSLDFLCISDLEGHFLKISPTWTRELGWREDELIGKNMMDFIHPEDRDRSISETHLLAGGKRTVNFQNRYRRADGSWIWLSWTSIGLPDRGVLLGSAHDITSQLLAEQQLVAAREEAEQASRGKSQFIATMSHELRTPLNAVLGYSLLLDSFVKEERGRNYLKSITSAGKSLLAIINDLLDLTKVEAGRIELKLVPFDPKRVLREIEEIFRFSAEEKGISLEINASERLPLSVLLDPDRLRQVLINLVGNAVKFTERGSVTIRMDALNEGREDVNADPRASWKATLLIDVIDTGIGITGEYRKRLFEPFSQQDSEISRRFGGTGLGLAIAKRLLDLMGGTIVCESPEVGGTHFRIEIPAISAAGISGETMYTFSGTSDWGRTRTDGQPGDVGRMQSELSEATKEIESLVARLNRLSTLDEPTGLMNRKSVFSRLQHEIASVKKHGGALSLILCDLDRFKKINDGWGYPVGDSLLVECARRLARAVGDRDTIGRWVSESYLVILPDTGVELARQQAEKLRRAIEAEPILLGGESFNLTASLGVSTIMVDSAEPADSGELLVALLRSVDDAQYRAKAKGRNRIEVIEARPPTGAPPTPPTGPSWPQ